MLMIWFFSQGTVCTGGFFGDLRSEFWQEDELTGTLDSYTSTRVLMYHNWLLNCGQSSIHNIWADDLKNSRSYYPGNDQLMKIDYNSPSLSLKDAKLFHQHVARLLFASKRARPDIQVWVALLCTRVKSQNKQDYKKLGRVISYLKETVYLQLVIGANNCGTLTWNTNALFAVYPDCKSHTGACRTLRHGSVLSISAK